MGQRPLRSQKSNSAANRRNQVSTSLSIRDIERYSQDWIYECEYRQHSSQTLTWRRNAMKKLLWFLNKKENKECGTSELRAFLSYLTNGHKEPEGRWDNPRFDKPVSSRTVKDYHGSLRTFFNWLVEDGAIEASPVERIPAPIHRPDQIQPFTPEQVQALMEAARRSRESKRNEALLLLAVDTGCRATELCELRMKDVDFNTHSVRVLGKGNKHRSSYFGRVTAKALWRYVREEARNPDDPLFMNWKSTLPMNRNGFRLLMRRLGKDAGIAAVRCSPHTLRHTFAINFLRNGGNIWSLKELLGHSQLQQTLKYAAIADADVEKQHRLYSPSDSLCTSTKAQNRGS